MLWRMDQTALIVVDVQKGFHDPGWGERNNPRCEENIAALIAAWRDRGEPIVYVRHDGTSPESHFRPGTPGNDLQDFVDGEPDLLVAKAVNSSFHGTPDLDAWLRERGIERVAICGIQTNMCCETTARMGGNLGYDVAFVLDATHTFDLPGPDGFVFAAEEVARMTAANLDGEFATVVSTDDYVRR